MLYAKESNIYLKISLYFLSYFYLYPYSIYFLDWIGAILILFLIEKEYLYLKYIEY